jgi:hypothetical protein
MIILASFCRYNMSENVYPEKNIIIGREGGR